MNKFKFGSLLAGAAFVAMTLTSCDDTTTNPVGTTNTPTVAKNIRATSLTDKSISVMFDKATCEDSTWFSGYEISLSGEATITPVTKTKAGTAVTFEGLTEGKIYTILVKSKAGTVSVTDSIKWSPASRFVLNGNDADIKVYETASGFGSGLSLYNESDKAPMTYKVANGANWDLGLSTKSGLIFGSATKLDYTITPTSKTEITEPVSAASLNAVYDSQSLDLKSYSEKSIDLTKFTSNIVIYVKRTVGTDVNYAKVMLKYVGTSFLQGSGSDRYVQCEISYQKSKGVPYAKISE